MAYLQQGDVLLKEYTDRIKGKTIKDSLLHKGQNHHHRLSGGSFKIIEGENKKYLHVTKQTSLTHEEHKTIKIPAGKYFLYIVQEYDHWLEESRAVID